VLSHVTGTTGELRTFFSVGNDVRPISAGKGRLGVTTMAYSEGLASTYYLCSIATFVLSGTDGEF
jgi:hypothetical protein